MCCRPSMGAWVRALNNTDDNGQLGGQFGRLGRHAEAAEILQRVVDSEERPAGKAASPEHCEHLATELEALGRPADAARLRQKVADIRQRRAG